MLSVLLYGTESGPIVEENAFEMRIDGKRILMETIDCARKTNAEILRRAKKTNRNPSNSQYRLTSAPGVQIDIL